MCLVGPNMWDTCAMGATTVWDTRRLGLTTKMKMFSYHNTKCTMYIVLIVREIFFCVWICLEKKCDATDDDDVDKCATP